MLANNEDFDQMPHYVASGLGLHCLPMVFYGFPGKYQLNSFQICMVVAIETVGVTKQLSVTVEMMDAYPVNVHLVTVAMATTAQDHVR